MKLVSFRRDESVSCGVLLDGGILDIAKAWEGADAPRSVKEILTRGAECMAKVAGLAERGGDLVSADSVRLVAPIPQPGKCIALAGNYSEHIKEASVTRGFNVGLSDSPRLTTAPRPFIMPTTAVAGPGDEVAWPVYSETIDYEIELAVVIGRKVKCVAAEEALEAVAGCTIANDISARTVTFKAGRVERPWDEFYDWLNGKWADGFLPMGPYVLTADEVEDVQDLAMELKVNGEVRQNANTGQMIYPVADIVSFLSHIMTLEPGDIIATGTPSGVGLATGNYLKAGDKIEASIEGLGTLVNTLGERPGRFYEPLKG